MTSPVETAPPRSDGNGTGKKGPNMPTSTVPAPPLGDLEAARVATAVVLAGVGAMFSAKLAGRLAISNIPQAISLVILLLGVRRLLRPIDVAFILFSALGVIAAYMAVLLDYNYVSSPAYAAFFFVSGSWLAAIYRCCQRPGGVAAIQRGFRRLLPIVFAIFLVRAGIGIARGAVGNLGFDDKSHAAVYAVSLALIALQVMSGRAQFFLAVGFMAISMATRSRLPYLFLPALVVGVLHSYRHLRSQARTGLSAYIAHLAMAAVLVAPVIAASRLQQYFESFFRTFQPTGTARRSTDSHLLLIQHGAQLKIDSLANFLFGITPRGFGGVLYRSSHDLTQIASTDPGVYRQLVTGTAPMHSSIGSIIVEFPIWISLLFVILIVSLGRAFVRNRAWVPLMFLISFAIATSFYSNHTEVFFYVVLAAITAAAFARRRDGHAEASA